MMYHSNSVESIFTPLTPSTSSCSRSQSPALRTRDSQLDQAQPPLGLGAMNKQHEQEGEGTLDGDDATIVDYRIDASHKGNRLSSEGYPFPIVATTSTSPRSRSASAQRAATTTEDEKDEKIDPIRTDKRSTTRHFLDMTSHESSNSTSGSNSTSSKNHGDDESSSTSDHSPLFDHNSKDNIVNRSNRSSFSYTTDGTLDDQESPNDYPPGSPINDDETSHCAEPGSTSPTTEVIKTPGSQVDEHESRIKYAGSTPGLVPPQPMISIQHHKRPTNELNRQNSDRVRQLLKARLENLKGSEIDGLRKEGY